MGLPQEDESGSAPDPADPAATPADPKPEPARPDWLVGADMGLEMELGRRDETAGPPPLSEAPKTPRIVPPGARPGAPGSPAGPPKSRLPDLDDARLQVTGWTAHREWLGGMAPEETPDRKAPSEPAGNPVVDHRPARTPPDPPAEVYAAVPRLRSLPDEEPDPAPARSIVVDRLLAAIVVLFHRTWKWVAGAAVAALAAVLVARAIGIGTTPMRDILRDPARFDGRSLKVRGRVGDDVFPVGAGYTFFLLRGRDSLVVFTRSRVPRPHETLELEGQVSTGTVAGVDRPALLESVH